MVIISLKIGVLEENEALTAEWGDGSVDGLDEDTFTVQLKN